MGYFISMLSSLLGITYWFFTKSENEVRVWGILALLAGVIILVLLPKVDFQKKSIQVIGLGGFLLLGLAQIPALSFWASSSLISDGPEGVIGLRWGILPHLLLLSSTVWISLYFLLALFGKKWKLPSALLFFVLILSLWNLYLGNILQSMLFSPYESETVLIKSEVEELKSKVNELEKEIKADKTP